MDHGYLSPQFTGPVPRHQEPHEEDIEGLSPIASQSQDDCDDEGSEPSQDCVELVENALKPAMVDPKPRAEILYPSETMFELFQDRSPGGIFSVEFPTRVGFPSKDFLIASLLYVETQETWPIPVFVYDRYLRLEVHIRGPGEYVASLTYTDPNCPARFSLSPYRFFVKELVLDGPVYLSASEIARLDATAARTLYKHIGGPSVNVESLSDDMIRSALVLMMKKETGEKDLWAPREFTMVWNDVTYSVIGTHALGQEFILNELSETINVVGFRAGTNATVGNERRTQIRLSATRGERQKLINFIGVLTRFQNSAVAKWGDTFGTISVIESQLFFTPSRKIPHIDFKEPTLAKRDSKPTPVSPLMALVTTKKTRTAHKLFATPMATPVQYGNSYRPTRASQPFTPVSPFKGESTAKAAPTLVFPGLETPRGAVAHTDANKELAGHKAGLSRQEKVSETAEAIKKDTDVVKKTDGTEETFTLTGTALKDIIKQAVAEAQASFLEAALSNPKFIDAVAGKLKQTL